ncbi:pitrilysin family protein [Leuconostocaceae bacterium ESL0723]|nr:pitrilysin family protein [Leuconostocaceae bacterium ESL0723]
MSTIPLAGGVNLKYLPSQQFKTIQVGINFSTAAQPQSASVRALLSYVMAASADQYPSQKVVAQRLIDLAGAQYQTDVSRVGQVHQVQFGLQFTQPTYVGEGNDYLRACLDFMAEMVFHPIFDKETVYKAVFKTEQAALLSDLDAIADDTVRLALSRLRQQVLPDAALKDSALGNRDEVAALTLTAVKRAYEEMVANDRVTVVVAGDVDQETVADWSRGLSLGGRQVDLVPWYHAQDFEQPVISQGNQAELSQAVLTQSYDLTVAPGSKQRFAAQVLNMILGGGPLSALFLTVREQNSLAYMIYTYWRYDLGMLTLVAGVAPDQVGPVQEEVVAIIDQLAEGESSLTTLAEAKRALINDYLSQLDSPSLLVKRAYLRDLVSTQLSPQEWVQAVENVTADDVSNLAKQLKLRGQYTLIPKDYD